MTDPPDWWSGVGALTQYMLRRLWAVEALRGRAAYVCATIAGSYLGAQRGGAWCAIATEMALGVASRAAIDRRAAAWAREGVYLPGIADPPAWDNDGYRAAEFHRVAWRMSQLARERHRTPVRRAAARVAADGLVVRFGAAWIGREVQTDEQPSWALTRNLASLLRLRLPWDGPDAPSSATEVALDALLEFGGRVVRSRDGDVVVATPPPAWPSDADRQRVADLVAAGGDLRPVLRELAWVRPVGRELLAADAAAQTGGLACAPGASRSEYDVAF